MNDFLKECEKSDMLWRSGVKATERNPFDCYNEYCITVGFEEEKCLEYASEEFYESKGYKIVNYKNLTKPFTKEDLKDGDIVTDREGDKSIFHDSELYGNTVCFEALNDDLTGVMDYSNEDIVKVERPVTYETVFEREEEATEQVKTEKISKLSYQQLGTYLLERRDFTEYTNQINKQISQIGQKINEIIDRLNEREKGE